MASRPYLCRTSRIFVVTGPAGTGKSTHVMKMVTESSPMPSQVIITGPTHTSVHEMKRKFLGRDNPSTKKIPPEKILARTIFSYFRIPPSIFPVKVNIDDHDDHESEILIIDEVSMIDIRVLRAIMKRLVRMNYGRIYLIGDPCQLQSPSVSIIFPIKHISYKKLEALSALTEEPLDTFTMKHLSQSFIMNRHVREASHVRIVGMNRRAGKHVARALDILRGLDTNPSLETLSRTFCHEKDIQRLHQEGWVVIVNSYKIISDIYSRSCRDTTEAITRKSCESRLTCPITIRKGDSFFVYDRRRDDHIRIDGGFEMAIQSGALIHGDFIAITEVHPDKDTFSYTCPLADDRTGTITLCSENLSRVVPLLPGRVLTPYVAQGSSFSKVIFYPIEGLTDPITSNVSVTRAVNDLMIALPKNISEYTSLSLLVESFMHNRSFMTISDISGEIISHRPPTSGSPPSGSRDPE